MGIISDLENKVFSTKSEGKLITGLVLILTAIVLIFAALCTRTDFSCFKNIVPLPKQIATSPIAQEILENKNKQTANAPLNTVPEKNAAPSCPTITQNIPEEKTAIAPTKPALVPEKPATAPDAERSDMVIIPRLEVTEPIITAETKDDARLHALLDQGAVLYPDSADVGARGQTVLLGHSAPANWPKIKHDTIFSRIVELAAGDKIIAIYNDKTYNYSVVHSEIIAKGSEIPQNAVSDNSLVLVTCWPPGRDLKRIIVEAELESVE